MLNYEFPPLGGGAGPVSLNIAKELVKNGHEVDVVTMGFRGLPKEESIEGVKVYRVPCFRSGKAICMPHEMLSYVISAYFFCKKLLKKNKYDINHTHFIIPTGIVSLLLWKKFKLPYVVTSHGSDVPGFNPDRFVMMHKVVGPIWRKVIVNSRKIITPSDYLKGLIRKSYDWKNITTIPNGIYPEEFKAGNKENKILLVSRLVPRKGFQHFIEAIKDLDIDKEWDINLVGDGSYKKDLQKLAEKYNKKISFTGWIDNKSERMKELYATSSIYVLPSLRENSSIALLEAMSAKMAIITTNVSGCPETVGDAAITVKPESPEEIKKALVKLINDTKYREKMAKKAYERVNKNFSWPIVAKKYIEVFRKAK